MKRHHTITQERAKTVADLARYYQETRPATIVWWSVLVKTKRTQPKDFYSKYLYKTK